MKILIVGAGIGGLSLAAFLKDSNIDYDIIEKCPNWDHQGYSLSIWNNGRNILKKLGLEEIFDKSGKRIKFYYIYNGQGRLLRKYSLSSFYAKYGMALTLTSRKDVHDWLWSKVDSSKVKMNTTIETIDQDDSGVTVVFNNKELKKYDLVVGADGIHSTTRSLVFKNYILSSTKWRVWWMWVDNKFKTEASVSEYIEPGEFVSLFDSGEKTLAIISALDKNEDENNSKTKIQSLKEIFKDEVSISPEIFNNLKDEDVVSSILIHINLKTWANGRVVLLGDAAHGFEPHAGIGGSMALEDGYVLAGELMKVSDTYPLTLALRNYEVARKKRVKIAQHLTNKMKAWGLVKSKPLRKVLNFIAPYFPESYFVKDYDKLLKQEI